MPSPQVAVGVAMLVTLAACALPPTAGTFGTKQDGGHRPVYPVIPQLLRTDRDLMIAQPSPSPPPLARPYRPFDPEARLLNPQPLPPSPDPPDYAHRRRFDRYLLNPQPLPPSPDPPEYRLRERFDKYLLNPQPLPPSPDPPPYERYRRYFGKD